MALADELGKLVDAVGGKEYAYYLLPPLENIAAVEEATVRDKVCPLAYHYRILLLYSQSTLGCCFALSYC